MASLGIPILDTYLHRLNISVHNQCVFLETSSSSPFAVLNEDLGKLLDAISRLNFTQFEAYLSIKDWQSFIDLIKAEKNTLSIDIVLYGPTAIQEGVGKLLADTRVYLQHPCYRKPEIKYDNPHFWDLDHIASASSHFPGQVRKPSSLQINDQVSTLVKATDTSPSSSVQLRRKISTIFDSLSRSKKLGRLGADSRVVTTLLP
jgi:hypothetical protein